MSLSRPLLASLLLGVAFALPVGAPTPASQAGHSLERPATPPAPRRAPAGEVVPAPHRPGGLKLAPTPMKPLAIGAPLARAPRHRPTQLGVLGGPSTLDARRLVRR
jgi:hypothetical protein